MQTRRFTALAAAALLAIAACTPAPSTAPSAGPSAGTNGTPAPSGAAGPANPEAVITGVEDGSTITFWTYYLSPTFDTYIEDTIARFNEAYPNVTVKWEDHQGTFEDDLKNAFNAGNAPDVINLSVSAGWVADYAGKGLLLPLDDKVPDSVKSLYFEGLWKEQLVNGVNFQFPWYQGIAVNLINTQIYTGNPQPNPSAADGSGLDYVGGAGLKVADFPKTIDGLPALCRTIKEKTDTLCDVRLTQGDLLSQMVYEGNVKVLSDDGSAFTFDSPEAVAWLNMYVGMINDKTLDKSVLLGDPAAADRAGLDLFTSGKAAFYATGPNLIREVRKNNPALYGFLAVVPAPLGKSGVAGKGLMSISVKADTKAPNASIALAQFFTNPTSMLEFAKIVPVYPSTPSSYDDPFFSSVPTAIEDSARPIAKQTVSTYQDIVPTIPHKADVEELVLQAVQKALFDGADPQQALSEAVAAANALLP